ncbi:AMP-binding protein [Solirubrobacter sp. CPCC 204708]|uniref:AMP-binding protein n=1 Tax=Solirubrobacter deserti TaxID=2282478 RepID=A0ABT4RJ57_9ACTN|nr:AMP-binding protein [Solirubrobacter deserti]MBE2317629.1 AMP-binding protein [Solirubrobacter deserti]MDA0138579.1 AMP-binding protein [Solirubrobacter deserti]
MSNFAARILQADGLALIERTRSGERREWTFPQVRERVEALARALDDLGLRGGDVVLTLIGNRPAWVFTMLAAFRQGYVVLPCNEQLRAKDLRQRLGTVPVCAVVADPRNRAELEAARVDCPVLWTDELPEHTDAAPAVVATGLDEPALMTFTSGTSGLPKCVVHAHRYLWGQRLQGRHWMDVRSGDRVWCTAASGWSKSARNAFIAPWLQGAAAVLHDGRFDAQERMHLLAEERVDVLCMAPTEYRVIVKRDALRPTPTLRSCLAAGEALNPEILRVWSETTGVEIRDGYGQTETGQITAMPAGVPARPGSMGRPLPGVRCWIEDGELVLDPSTVPTFFLGYHDHPAPVGPWRTGDRVHADEDGYLYFEGRADDVIVSAGYRIGPFEVESALLEHPAVADAAAVAAPDSERGSIVRAVVVLRDGFAAGPDLARELQEHVKGITAPYKYPRRVDFVDALPRTVSGKLRRSALR